MDRKRPEPAHPTHPAPANPQTVPVAPRVDDPSLMLTFTPAGSVADMLGVRADVTLTIQTDPASAPTRQLPPPPLAEPAPKYTPGPLLGRGGMGEVRTAVDRDLRRQVAVKTLLPRHGQHLLQQFVEEAQVTGQLEHPNIVPIYELGIVPQSRTPYLVMKQVRGRTLAQVLADVRSGRGSGLGGDTLTATVMGTASDLGRTRGDSGRMRSISTRMRTATSTSASATGTASRRLQQRRGGTTVRRPAPGHEVADEPEAPHTAMSRLLDVFLKVCDAIAYAHARGVIHRDLKPDNVMVGAFGEVLVMDWGLAKVIDTPRPGHASSPMLASSPGPSSIMDESVTTDRGVNPSAAHTVDGTVKGTPMYMSPEQARGAVGEIDQQSDVYALGAILYELLTLARPHEGETSMAVLNAVRRGEVVPPSERNRAPWSIPRELEAVVRTAMASDKRDRYANVLSLKADIEAYRAGRTVGAAEYSPWQMLAKWAQRHKTAVVGAAATIVAMLAGIIAVTVVATDAQAQQARFVLQQQLDDAENAREQAEAAEQARLDTEQAARDRAVEQAQAVMRAGDDAWEAADAEPFNPAAPQEWLQAHVGALMQMGRAMQTLPSPDGAPRAWRETLAARALEVQTRAQDVGDWAIASVLAESAQAWHAVDADEGARRESIVHAARERAIAEDVARFVHVLELIREAEAMDERGSRDLRLMQHDPFITAELLEERAHQVASLTHRRELADRAVAWLTYDTETRLPETRHRDILGDPQFVDVVFPLSGAQRLVAIETLGRLGITHARWHEVDTVLLVETAIARALHARLTATEVAAWVRAMGRLESISPGAFNQPETRILAWVERNYADNAEVLGAVREVREYWDLLDGGELPRMARVRDGDSLHVRRLLNWLGDWCAQSVRSGSAYTAHVLARVDDDASYEADGVVHPVSARQRVFAIGQLGLHGDQAQVAMVRADGHTKWASAPLRLMDMLRSTPAEHLADNNTEPSQSPSNQPWTAAARRDFECAVAAGRSLARLDSTQAGELIWRQRNVCGENSAYWRETVLTMRLFPETWMQSADLGGNEQTPVYYQALVSMLEERGDYAGAIEACSDGIALDPTYAPLWRARAQLHYRMGRLRESIDDATEAIRLDPTVAQAYSTRGVSYLALGQPQRAVDDFTDAIRCRPDPGWYSNRGYAYAQLQQFEAALDDLDRAIEGRPNNVSAYLIRGVVRRAAGDLEGAIEDYTHALQLDPANTAAYNNRAVARTDIDDFAGAIEDATEAIRLEPNNPAPYNTRATARYRSGDNERAIDDYESALRIDPKLWQAWVNKALLLFTTGRRDESREAFDEALRHCPPQQRGMVERMRAEYFAE